MRAIAVLMGAAALGACAHGEASFAKFSSKHPGAELLPVGFVKQREAADCGTAALSSVGQFWGASGLGPDGTGPEDPEAGYSIGELREASSRLGLASSGLLEAPDYVLGLVEEGMPVIAPLAKPYERRDIFDFMIASMLSRLIVQAFTGEATVNHYVVVLGADERLVYVLDPQDGYRALERETFIGQWRALTAEFLPEAGADVAAFVAYRPAPQSSAASFDVALTGHDEASVWGATH